MAADIVMSYGRHNQVSDSDNHQRMVGRGEILCLFLQALNLSYMIVQNALHYYSDDK